MNICVIGAGSAGLAAARQATDSKYNHSCVIFEQTAQIGGTWVYTNQTGTNEFGFPVHTSMYKNLRTNLPKEIMGYPDFPIPNYEESYITQEQILQFLNSYADHFQLRKLIQFYNRVKHIEPNGNHWKITVTNLKTKEDKIYDFDAVMICNGHYHTPRIPQILGEEKFKGKLIHSHDFRDVNDFTGQSVLVIGAGPSGMDIALNITSAAKKVYFSHHCPTEIKTVFPENLIQKPDVASMTNNEIIFADETREDVDIVMYCTGYLYNFPFLDKKSGICVDDNHVKPLYKHLININNPTMCFIGLPFYVCAFSMFDLQSRFFMEYLKGNFMLPSKEDMVEELNQEMRNLFLKGYSKKHAHMMGPKQSEYYESLSNLAKITPLPPVMTQLHNASTDRFSDDLVNFRNDVFKIVNDHTFVQVK